MLQPDTAEGLIEVLYQEIQRLKEQNKVLQDENLTLGSMYEHERLHNKAIKDMGGGNLEWLHELLVNQSNEHYKTEDRRPPKAEDKIKLIKLIRFMCPGTGLMAAKALVDEWEKTGSLHMQLIFEYDECGVDRFGVKVKTRKQSKEDHDALVESIRKDILEDLKENKVEDVKVSLPPPPSTGIPKRAEKVQAPILHYTDISFGGPPLGGEFLAQVDWDKLRDLRDMHEDYTPLKVSPKTDDEGPACYIIKPPSFFQGTKWLLVRAKAVMTGGLIFDFVYEVTERVVE